MSLPHIPDDPDDFIPEDVYEEMRDNAIELAVNRMLDRDYEREEAE